MKLSPTQAVQAGKFSMAAMSDMAFLLIIFFMVCSKFVERSDIPIDLPLSATGVQAEDVPTTIAINAEGTIFVDGVSMPESDLLPELRARMRAAESLDEKTVIVRADRSLEYRHIRPIKEAVERAGGMLELAVLGE